MEAPKKYVCIKCGEAKTADEYYRTRGKMRRDCIKCVLLWQKEYYANNKPKIQEYQRTYRLLTKNP
jgi:hypothetical protein